MERSHARAIGDGPGQFRKFGAEELDAAPVRNAPVVAAWGVSRYPHPLSVISIMSWLYRREICITRSQMPRGKFSSPPSVIGSSVGITAVNRVYSFPAAPVSSVSVAIARPMFRALNGHCFRKPSARYWLGVMPITRRNMVANAPGVS
jgi:hypothetical protein